MLPCYLHIDPWWYHMMWCHGWNVLHFTMKIFVHWLKRGLINGSLDQVTESLQHLWMFATNGTLWKKVSLIASWNSYLHYQLSWLGGKKLSKLGAIYCIPPTHTFRLHASVGLLCSPSSLTRSKYIFVLIRYCLQVFSIQINYQTWEVYS